MERIKRIDVAEDQLTQMSFSLPLEWFQGVKA